jgi:hypothetical protein
MTTTPTETRTYRVIYRDTDPTEHGRTFDVLVDGHDMDDAMSFRMHGAVAVSAVEVPGSRRPLGRLAP